MFLRDNFFLCGNPESRFMNVLDRVRRIDKERDRARGGRKAQSPKAQIDIITTILFISVC